MVFWIGFLVWYFTATEIGGSVAKGGATQLIFKRRAEIPEVVVKYDEESTPAESSGAVEVKDLQATDGAKDKLPQPKGIFSWHHLSYDITIQGGERRRLLDDVSGFVAPGKLVCRFFLSFRLCIHSCVDCPHGGKWCGKDYIA